MSYTVALQVKGKSGEWTPVDPMDVPQPVVKVRHCVEFSFVFDIVRGPLKKGQRIKAELPNGKTLYYIVESCDLDPRPDADLGGHGLYNCVAYMEAETS